MIAADLASLAVSVDKLSLLPGNPRRGDTEAVARSLARFGQRKPIVARRDGVVVAGNHTLEAARQLGWSEIAVVWVDDDEATSRAFALADNRTAELGGYDEAALLAMLQSVGSVDPELLAAASYDLDALLGNGQPNPYTEWEGMPEFEAQNLESFFHVVVHFRSPEDAEAFFHHIDRPKARSMWWPESDSHKGSDTSLAYVAADAAGA